LGNVGNTSKISEEECKSLPIPYFQVPIRTEARYIPSM